MPRWSLGYFQGAHNALPIDCMHAVCLGLTMGLIRYAEIPVQTDQFQVDVTTQTVHHPSSRPRGRLLVKYQKYSPQICPLSIFESVSRKYFSYLHHREQSCSQVVTQCSVGALLEIIFRPHRGLFGYWRGTALGLFFYLGTFRYRTTGWRWLASIYLDAFSAHVDLSMMSTHGRPQKFAKC